MSGSPAHRVPLTAARSRPRLPGARASGRGKGSPPQ